MISREEFTEIYDEAMEVLLRYCYEGRIISAIENVLVNELPHRDRKDIRFVAKYIKGKGYFKNGELTAEGIDAILQP
jgi:hypothetical protein